MNKENKTAAGLRRSAIAERIRLREEWSELKGCESQPNANQKNVLTKKQTNIKTASGTAETTGTSRWRKPSARNGNQTDNVLCGVVALVEVGSEPRALPLRAALAALGASVLPSWSPLVTHLVWSHGGCRSTRARARALACRLVSPLWVEACAAAARRLPEQAFPAAARPSDLPSPKTLTRLLKRAEMENLPLADLLSDSAEEKQKELRLRISSETERDTSGADTSGDVSRDTSRDESHDKSSKSSEKRRGILKQLEAPPGKARRKLFTQKEAEEKESEESEEDTAIPKPRRPSYKPAPKGLKSSMLGDRRQLARAERRARKILTGGATPAAPPRGDRPRIVLSGMSRSERRVVSAAVLGLRGRLQASVDNRTTHVLLGTFLHNDEFNKTVTAGSLPSTGRESNPKLRTLSALCGAARGCRVLAARWALDSEKEGQWIHHHGYEVPHLRKISEKARVQRSAWRALRAEYAYNVFCGMRVRIAADAARRPHAELLLRMCGAELQDGENCNAPARTQNGVLTQNGGLTQNGRKEQTGTQFYVTQRPECEYDVRIGCADGDVTSQWVFDSVAAGRMRNTRRYLACDVISQRMQQLGC